ncbi:hypothetical protein ONZ51_g4948 [Trametes cubensis]|uniref:Protein kinase domain-containing protein n=1 Tax=Trametes cubensis TaxID=1111947 RepID=A0AAD7TV15_9APHY|nr:hypothetical protein ONZ51_g4948 [Trametes cubensis]
MSNAPILDGRYASHSIPRVAAPVEIHHPAFAIFLGHVNDPTLSVPDDTVKTTAQFMLSQSQIATVENQRTNIRLHLGNLLGISAIPNPNWNRTSSHHVVTIPAEANFGEQAALAIVEEKGELGTNGEPSVQGSFSYHAFWNDADRPKLLKACPCPSFIISVAGPWLVICGAIYSSLPVVHRLTDYIWLGYSRAIDDGHILRVARIFYALHLGMQNLKTYYETLEYNPEDTTSRYFPLATSYVQPNGEKVEFKYKAPLKVGDLSCVTYLATDCRDPQRKLIVKFVERYGEKAHKLLAENQLAPELLYYGDVWTILEAARGSRPRQMVVMEYIRGRTAAELKEVPQCVRDAIKRALELLHEKKMVHGDIRLPNVIIQDRDEGEEGDGGNAYGGDKLADRVKLIDFHWAGDEGTVRYPHFLSRQGRVAGVEDYGFILAAHDDAMVRKLL